MESAVHTIIELIAQCDKPYVAVPLAKVELPCPILNPPGMESAAPRAFCDCHCVITARAISCLLTYLRVLRC